MQEAEKIGLSSKEAAERLAKYGSNFLPEKPPPTSIAIFLSQLKNPLVYILIFAGSVSLFLQDFSDAAIIFLAVAINTILGFIQERKASRSLASLKKLLVPTTCVIRDGMESVVNVGEVVPGDICILKQGDKVPADGVLSGVNRLTLSEAMLTGESVPVNKDEGDKVYMGTVVAAGAGRMKVIKTGEETEIGKIAFKLQEEEEKTPLQEQLAYFGKQLSIFIFLLTLFVFIVGILTGKDIFEIFKTSVALAVSAIPEGLLVGLTVVLAIGMQRILKKKGLVRNLVSAETLGGVTTICVDKTGTLTMGELQIEKVLGDERIIAEQIVNTPDDTIMGAAKSWLKKIEGFRTEKYERLDFIPFSPQYRYFASLSKTNDGKTVAYVNGAPEMLLQRCSLEKTRKIALKKEIEKLTAEGKRVIGLARKEFSQKTKLNEEELEKELDWVGLLVFFDPVRIGVKEAVNSAHGAGIKLVLITGDFPQTAQSVVKTLGLKSHPKVILGDELEKMTAAELSSIFKEDEKDDREFVRIFARTRPEQKLKVVEALKANGETVAMMGDGVNDAPALKEADIGIVVGEASDVAKESADMVLLDSSFATVIAAIREGRGIFDNIRKIILYLMSDAFEEIIAVTGAILLGLPLPVTAAQILWINLVSDGLPHMALTVDPKMPGIMSRSPRNPNERIVAGWMNAFILMTSLIGGILALGVFIYFYKTTNDLVLAQSITFATLGVNSLFFVYAIRTLKDPFWMRNPFDNKWLNLAVVGGLVFQLTPFLIPQMRSFLGLTSLTSFHWMVVVATALIVFVSIEIAKLVFRLNLKLPKLPQMRLTTTAVIKKKE
jgi:P-type Ca2+ transporter type 2C